MCLRSQATRATKTDQREYTAEWNLTFLGPVGLEDGSILQSPTRGEVETNINLKKQRK